MFQGLAGPALPRITIALAKHHFTHELIKATDAFCMHLIGGEVLDAQIERTATPLTLMRLLELAPSERLREMREDLERDMELDRAAMLEWRRQQTERCAAQ